MTATHLPAPALRSFKSQRVIRKSSCRLYDDAPLLSKKSSTGRANKCNSENCFEEISLLDIDETEVHGPYRPLKAESRASWPFGPQIYSTDGLPPIAGGYVLDKDSDPVKHTRVFLAWKDRKPENTSTRRACRSILITPGPLPSSFDLASDSDDLEANDPKAKGHKRRQNCSTAFFLAIIFTLLIFVFIKVSQDDQEKKHEMSRLHHATQAQVQPSQSIN